MRPFERFAIYLRRSAPLRRADTLWNWARPFYTKALTKVASGGLERNINGTDLILLAPELYTFSEIYEPEVWSHIMTSIRPGDIVADVGAYLGLYAIAMSKRAGLQGTVYAFEPDLQSVTWLRRNIRLNRLDDSIKVFPTVVADEIGIVEFVGGRGSESHVLGASSKEGKHPVDAVTLDMIFANSRLDILKIDVEGYEEAVLRGGRNLLTDTDRAPRVIYIEVHPFAWSAFHFSSESLLELLASFGYTVHDLQGNSVAEIKDYGEIIAYKNTEID